MKGSVYNCGIKTYKRINIHNRNIIALNYIYQDKFACNTHIKINIYDTYLYRQKMSLYEIVGLLVLT